ncbi:phosphodiesterase [Dongia deserti]|uniref:phosphodiesterase n=1 Tax=Dongia deserti TaxID=2268030 RepID=UPI000E657152|nr:phosphodiesterase [Dongia deserti]
MLIAQISDTHIRPKGVLAMGRVDTAGHLARAVAHLTALRPAPDVVLVTGDLVDAGMAEEYAHFRELLAPLRMPVYLIPGNHDLRDPLRAVFAEHRYLPSGDFIQYVVDDKPVRLIALDTLTPGAPHGELCEERLDWLEARLGESDRPTILFMHHPPFECGMKEFDEARLNVGADRLAAIVSDHPNIERILCGHVHRPIQMRWAGTIASVAPSTAHQATLDLSPDAPLMYSMDPPAVALHQWRPGAGLVTHFSYVGEYDGPYPF